MALGTLTIDIEANTSRLQSDLGKAAQATDGLMSQMKGYAEAAMPALAAMGAAVAAAGAVAVRNSAMLADELGQVSAQSGLTVESLSGLRFAAMQSDTDFATLAGGLKKLRLAQVDAMGGNKELVALFKALGVEIRNADGSMRSSETVFMDLADAYTTLSTEQERTAVLTKLMGKSADDLGQVMGAGAAGIRAFQEENRRLGGELSGQTVDQVKQMLDNIDAMSTAASGLANTLLSNLAPSLTNITTAMRQAAADSGVLEAALVGLGGVVTETWNAFRNKADIAATDDEIQKVSASIAQLQAQLSAGSTDPEGANGWFASVLMPDIKLSEEAIERGRKSLEDLERQLEWLERHRDELSGKQVEKLEVQSRGQTASPSAPTTNIIAAAAAAQQAADKQAEAAKQLQQAYDQQSAALERQVALYGQVSEAARVRYEVEHGALAGVSEQQRKHLEQLAEEADYQNRRKAAELANAQGQRELESLRQQLLTEEEAIAESHRRRQEIILRNTEEGSALQQEMLRRVDEQRLRQTAALEAQRNGAILQGAQGMFDAMAGLAEASAGKQSGAYRTLFAISKAFALADSVLKLNQAIMGASVSAPFPANLAAMASIASSLGGVVSAISGAQFSGAYDSGGYIPPGKIGLVGELGPELVSGPANVTSRRRTAELFGAKGEGGNVTTNQVQVNVTISDGGTSSSASAEGAESVKQFGNLISIKVKETLIQESRQGGMLWKLKNGS